MARRSLTIEDLWQDRGFEPNAKQKEAILHVDGPLFLPAGPGSGKTRVLLWRALNLIVFHDVDPEEIYLSTFTEKAARQLKEGLQAYLGTATNLTGKAFDISPMYVGTVHSLCQRLLTDRRFSSQRRRPRPPQLLDELGQYFFLYRARNWAELLASVGLDPQDGANQTINAIFGKQTESRHQAVTSCIGFFNRLSEECIEPEQALSRLEAMSPDLAGYLAEHELDADGMQRLVAMYDSYRRQLGQRESVPQTDFSLIQQEAYKAIMEMEGAGQVFRHVIVDEYQDTNTIQERFFFALAQGHRNLCVVGDDDQALYRFRGATVENFVEFPSRCQHYLGCAPRRIPLSINYRSRPPIVQYYGRYMSQCDWKRADGHGHYRVIDKKITPHRAHDGPAVVRTACGKPQECFEQIAALVSELLQTGKVQNANQIAFLYPSLTSVQVGRMKDALQARGLKVYAPRAGRFLEVEESSDVFGTLDLMFGSQGLGRYTPDGMGDWNQYRTWLHNAKERAKELAAHDATLGRYIADRQAEIQTAIADRNALLKVVERKSWDLGQPYDTDAMKRPLAETPGLSQQARRNLVSPRFDRAAQHQAEAGRPYLLRYVLRRATSLDWTVLDAFYRLCGMAHFRRMFDLAERGKDEGPICNLALISQYLRRFMDEYATVITADLLEDGMLARLLFGSYLFALWRLSESEYEDKEHPFPKGRIPFLTIHQAKGLEFPVVVLANPAKRDYGPQTVEVMVRPFLQRDQGEPLERVSEFDLMRMFYVALSRAENLLVIAHLQGQRASVHRTFRDLLTELPTLDQLDLDTVPLPREPDKGLPRFFSYTGDFLAYRRCARQYMIFRKYGFEGARTQTVFFGSLVHRTLDDLHNHLIARKAGR